MNQDRQTTTTARPYCRFCGKPIAKRTTAVRFVDALKSHMKGDKFTRYVIGRPTTKAEAQQLVNEQIVSVKHSSDPWNMGAGKYVSEGSVWDGESYVDPYFCNGTHAKNFAYAVAADRPGLAMPAYHNAVKKDAGQ